MREKIILSDIDLKILESIEKEKTILELGKSLDIYYTVLNSHLKRLKIIKAIEIKKDGTFRKVKINRKGEEILKLLK